MEKNKDNLLHKLYYKTSSPGSFGGVNRLYNEARLQDSDITHKDVKDWLSGELTYTLHKPSRRRFKRNPILVSAIDEQWQADLVDMQDHQKSNKNYKYFITIIDIFSKYAWVVPLKNKSAKSILEAFKLVFKQRIPTKLQTDQGKEFDNKLLSNYLKNSMVQFFTAKNPDIKCAVVERFNRSLKNRMFKYFTANGTKKYIDILQDLVKSYNGSFHRTIKMRPMEVNRDNENKVFKNSYGFNDKREFLENKFKNSKLKYGDIVRKQYKLGPFDKSYYPLWTDSIYKVDKVTKGRYKPYHAIKDEQGNLISRRLYPEEIQKIKSILHRVEKVLKTRRKNGKTEYYVKWLNHPSSYNSWVDAIEGL